jgi:hypothetical protein
METQAEQLGRQLITVRPRQIGALPLIYPILSDLTLRQIVNAVVPSQADIDLGQIVVLLTLNRLLAPQPLYHVQVWLAETVLPQLLGLRLGWQTLLEEYPDTAHQCDRDDVHTLVMEASVRGIRTPQ